jgi:cytochrome b involved in lipid metabolism
MEPTNMQPQPVKRSPVGIILVIVILLIIIGAIWAFTNRSTTAPATETASSGQTSAPQETINTNTETPSPTTSASASPSSSSVKTYTLAEIAPHNSRTSCWMAIEGKVYNVTSFIPRHPGGTAILQGCGKDATSMFNSRPNDGTSHSAQARATLKQYYIGDLKV